VERARQRHHPRLNRADDELPGGGFAAFAGEKQPAFWLKKFA
jgi:hypothetical protein